MKCKLIFLLLVLTSCMQNVARTRNNITITVDAQRIPDQGFSISYMRSTVRGFEFDENKHAKCTIEDFNYLYMIIHNGFKEVKLMYLEKGDKVNLAFDGESMAKSLVIAGGCKPIQDYLDNINIRWAPDTIFAQEVPEFINSLKNLVAENQKSLDKYSDEINKVNRNFVKRENARIKYMMGLSILDYARAHPSMAKLRDYKPGQEYYDAILAWMDEDPDLLDLNEYRTVMTEGIAFVLGNQMSIRNPYEKVIQQVEYIQKNFKDEQVKQGLINFLVCSYVNTVGITRSRELVKLHCQYVSDKNLISQFQKIYDSWINIAPGKDAPDFHAVDPTGKKYSLKDFRGKYVYLYLWPTFQPSITEFSFLQELRPLLEERKVHLVSLSIDETPDSWSDVIQNKDLQIGTHLFIGRDKNFLKTYHYNSNNMYQFILIDPDGKIIEPHAPRPSSGKLKEFIKISTRD